MRITIIGAGAWGTALAVAMAPWNAVTLYVRDAGQFGALDAARENQRYLPGITLPDQLGLSNQFEASIVQAELLVLATPVAGLREVCTRLKRCAISNVVWLCKGLEEGRNALPHQVVAEVLPGIPAAVVSGPSFAQEVARLLPAALTVASTDAQLAMRVVEGLHHGALRVYRSDDVVGVEVGGAVKNILAIATGIADGLQLGANARAALITRGLAEMMRLGVALGGRSETLMGLTGVGDLILTCTGDLSRNRRVGMALAGGRTLADVLAHLGHVAEGVRCARAVRELARAKGVDMPITEAVCSVMFEEVSPRDAVGALMGRAARAEY
jgi:glycerol-3-phosphate dehydrogenase (NAD(P)+)